jgi:hypothetical protein
MSVTCPRGHQSVSDDYCDDCGARIGAPSANTLIPPSSRGPAASSSTTSTSASASTAGESCPQCATRRSGDDRYCEVCGYDLVNGPDPVSPRADSWRAEITADRAYFDRLGAPVEFPEEATPRSIELAGDEVTIGRRSRSQGIEPHIDLSASPEDPGVSHRHAAIRRDADGGWVLVDLGSTNGTAVNGSVDLIEAGTPVPINDGDRIHVGAWTTILIARVATTERGR